MDTVRAEIDTKRGFKARRRLDRGPPEAQEQPEPATYRLIVNIFQNIVKIIVKS